MQLARFLEAEIIGILQESKSLEQSRIAKVKQELKLEEASDGVEATTQAAEEEERQLLQGVAQVQSRLFEGRIHRIQRKSANIAEEWNTLSKRARSDRIVVVDGMTFIAPSSTLAEAV